jgi:hypothetical protein
MVAMPATAFSVGGDEQVEVAAGEARAVDRDGPAAAGVGPGRDDQREAVADLALHGRGLRGRRRDDRAVRRGVLRALVAAEGVAAHAAPARFGTVALVKVARSVLVVRWSLRWKASARSGGNTVVTVAPVGTGENWSPGLGWVKLAVLAAMPAAV